MADVPSADRIDEMLSQQLRRYADRRVRPVDPMAIATAAVVPKPARRLPWIRVAPRRGGAIRLALVASLLVLAGGLLLAGPGGGPPQSTPGQTASPGPEPTGRADALLAGHWGLDFVSSGLDPQVLKGMEHGLGSSLRFSPGGFRGAIGYGGGCAIYEGTFSVTAIPSVLSGEIQFAFTKLRQTCTDGTPQRVVDALIGARRFALMDCAPVPVASTGEDLFCRTLLIGDEVDANVLVYRRDE